ncbi:MULTISPECIES: DUF3429 domain-containing protein [Roseateles]|uniref:DUF3429 domain-containing protein n=1 Tax=Roseateles albus TaxID=2987525 RepID=A0ABT5KH38_9BURK|nr:MULTISPECIES: DUF3429 domain-containing protein [Roseateles]MCV2359807.1 DUF3429 domain-containing protein [Paucibacter sp. TC2R-5]MDC8772712.1 DUF3429 domain-containing protein [Roseateles albus]
MPVAANALAPLPLNPLALRLGHLGLLPFVFGAILVWLVGGRNAEAHAWISFSLSAYAALILSFLGGIYWGLGFRQVEPGVQPFVWGVLPSLGAWVALVMPAYAGLVLHGVMLIVCYLVDRRLYPALGAAAWLTLRFRLSAVAALCCFLAAAGS